MAIRSIDGERGFALAELVVCLALLVIVGAATIGAVATVARGAMPNVTRDVAAMVAENALARARAAAAYVPQGTGAAPADAAGAGLLVNGTAAFTAGAELRAPSLCGAGHASRLLRLPVQTSYAGGVFTVAVTYPRDACRVGADGTIPSDVAMTLTVHESLSPPVYVPGHVIPRTVGVPARM